MRPFLLALILLASSIVASPTASAAEPLLTDPAGDAEYSSAAGGTPLPAIPGTSSDAAKGSDLVSLEIVESEDALAFTLGVASLASEPTGVDAFTQITWGDEQYAVEIGYFSGGAGFGGAQYFAALLRRQGTEWEYAAVLDDPVVDTSAGKLGTSVPKVYFLDGKNRVPGRGDSLQIDRVIADTNLVDINFMTTRVTDSMPDGEGKGAAFTLTMGDHAQGSLVMSTPERVRVSNGGSTTFVFTIALRNIGQTEEEYALAAVDLPDGWNATLNSPVKVPPGQEKSVSVLVSVPFAHEHGGYSSFNVTAQSTRDAASNGRMRFGVVHTPIPQPAGHHSELFLHARDPRSGSANEVFATPFPYAYGWMNTQDEDPEDHEFLSASTDDESVVWWIPLNPSLQMGLDFDIEQLGAIEGTVRGNRDAAAEIAAELYYWRGDGDSAESILLAEGAPTDIALTQQGAAPFKLALTPTLDADYIAYAGDAGMSLRLSMTGANVQDQIGNTPVRPLLETQTFKMTLPLLEYHDRLSGEADVAQAITITAKGLVEKVGRPGSILTYPFEVRNDGPEDVLVLDLAGNDVAQARLVPAGEVTLATGQTREVTLAVEIPFDANAGQEFEVLLFVHARDDPSKMAIARTKTRATDQADEAMPDEAAELLAAQARENDTPGFTPFVVALAVALALVATRRRR